MKYARYVYHVLMIAELVYIRSSLLQNASENEILQKRLRMGRIFRTSP